METYLIFVIIAFVGKEIVSLIIQLGQQFFDEKLRISLTKDFSQSVIEKILTY